MFFFQKRIGFATFNRFVHKYLKTADVLILYRVQRRKRRLLHCKQALFAVTYSVFALFGFIGATLTGFASLSLFLSILCTLIGLLVLLHFLYLLVRLFVLFHYA